MKVKIIYRNENGNTVDFSSTEIYDIEFDSKTYSIYHKNQYLNKDNEVIYTSDIIHYTELISVKITR